MTTLTLVGRVTDALGHAAHRSYGWEGRVAVEHWRYQAPASTVYRSNQPGPIPVRRDHGARDIGGCIHLERRHDDSIVAVAQVDDADDLLLPRNGPVYWSRGLLYRAANRSDIQITELTAVTNAATIATTPVVADPTALKAQPLPDGRWLDGRGNPLPESRGSRKVIDGQWRSNTDPAASSPSADARPVPQGSGRPTPGQPAGCSLSVRPPIHQI